MAPRLTVLSGPSGVGKGTVVAALRERYPEVWLSVSCTTRPPRPGEVDGVEYHFASRDEFQQMIDNGELLEYAEFAGNLYGTPRAQVEERLARGEPALLEIELQGARQVREAMPDAHFVFLAPPSFGELERRLTGRGTESDEVIKERLERAKIELGAENEFDDVLVNDDVTDTVEQLIALMQSY